MVQKVIEVVGISKESFAKAAEAAVLEASKTIHGIKWARVSDLEMLLDEQKVIQYRCLARIFFDLDR
jgi:flavin-binding protein dodecin